MKWAAQGVPRITACADVSVIQPQSKGWFPSSMAHPLRRNIHRKNKEVKTNTNKVERKGKLWLVGSFDFWVLCPNRAAARLTAKALNQLEELGADRGREIRKSDSWEVEIQASERFGWKVKSKTWNVHSCGRQICCCATFVDAWTVQEAFALLSSVKDYRKLVA